jgi:hypothetical protein
MKKVTLFGLGAALLLTACSAPYREAPHATNFKMSEQKELQALHHWDIIAKNISDTLAKKINYPVYLTAKNGTKFEKILLKMIRNDLVNKGIEVKTSPEGAKLLQIDASAVKFRKDRDKWNDLQGSLVALGSGVWVAVQAAGTAFPVTAGIVAGESLYAYSFKHSKTPQYEIDVNVVIKDKNRYLASVNRVYFINDTDVNLYKDVSKNMYKLSVKGE